MIFYWDTSALLSLVFEETKTASVSRLASREQGLPGYTSFFSLIEQESAFFRRISDGTLKPNLLPAARLAAQAVESTLTILWPDEEVLRGARRFVLEHGLRPGDAVQLACAVLLREEMKDVAFVCLDERLCRAARATGLMVAP